MANLFLDGSKLFHHLDEVERWDEGEAFAPIHVEVDPTGSCNHRCLFCYADHYNHALGMLPRELFLNLMRNMGEMGVKSCLLAGTGEPLVNKHTVDAALAGFEAGVDMALNTNAIVLNEDKAARVLPALTWLRCSVMGHDAKTYAQVHVTKPKDFDIALANIAKAVEIKKQNGLSVTIGIQQVLLPENGKGVPELARIAKEIGVDYYVLKPFSVDQRNNYDADGKTALELMHEFEPELQQAAALGDENFNSIIRWNTFGDDGSRIYSNCLGLPFISQIAADGKVYTCCPFFGDDRYCLGDLKDASFSELWHGETARAVRKRVEEKQDVKKCMTHCRHHQINTQLWQLRNPPDHVSFI
ncbi:MAG: radical SAM protein [Rhodospirillaceae bacterium]|nr:radical SAM protein [Rhodospirillaceae bacterium]